MKLRDRENILALGGFLGAAALIAALTLALVSQLTAEPIRQARENNRTNAFHRLRLPDFDRIGDVKESDGVLFYPVEKDGKTVGFIGQGKVSGYGGEIEILVGFKPDGEITAVQILRHKETPGLGAVVCERTFQRTIFNLFAKAPEIPENKLLDQFDFRNAGDYQKLRLIKDGGNVMYLTGATVTSSAVNKGVKGICRAFCNGNFSGSMERE